MNEYVPIFLTDMGSIKMLKLDESQSLLRLK